MSVTSNGDFKLAGYPKIKIKEAVMQSIEYFEQYKWRIGTEIIKIKFPPKDDDTPLRLASYFRPHSRTKLKPWIELYTETIDAFVKDNIDKFIQIHVGDKTAIIDLLIKIIIYHETSHWIIDYGTDSSAQKYSKKFFVSSDNKIKIKDELFFQEAFAQYFTLQLLKHYTNSKLSIPFFEWFCKERILAYKDCEDKNAGKEYLLWKKLEGIAIKKVFSSIESCREMQNQSWKKIKELIKEK